MTIKKIIILLALLTIVSYAYTTTINIPTDYSTIQAGIDAAVDYDTVLVDTGTYVENIDFNGKNITVASLFLTTQDTSYISQTVIDGDNSGSVVKFNNGEDSTAVLTGFTITNGSANNGGGIFSNNSNSTMKNLKVKNNSSDNWGGGIFCYDNSSPRLVDVEITENSVTYYGGGLCCYNSSPRLENVTISNNTADGGSGIFCINNSSPCLVDVEITGNTATDGGGGIHCTYNSNPSLENVTISNNTANNRGGGIYCYNSSPSLVDVEITGNSANYGGGGMYYYDNSSPSLENVTISNNTADDGGGVYCLYNSSPSLVNCILWNDSPQEVYFYDYGESNSITISYSDIEGGESGVVANNNGTVYWEEGNIDLNPLFVDPTNGDYNLSWTNYPVPDSTMSPCIDAGDPTFPLDPDGTIADMGAYYYNQGQAVDDEPENITQNSFISYPNPITNLTNAINISFALKKPSRINIGLYNIKGQLVTEIFNDNKPSGNHTISSNIDNLASGIYFIKMDVDGKNRAVKKMVKIE